MQKKIIEIAGGHVPARILMIANRLGLFKVLSSNSGAKALTVKEVSRRLKTDSGSMERLMNALVALGLLSKQNRRYRLAREAASYLTPDGSESLCDSITLYDTFWEVWGELDRMIRRGRPIMTMMDLIKKDRRILKNFIHGMRDRAAQAAHMISPHLDFKRARTVLDLGAGPGVYALEWVKTYPRISATVFDIPSVVPITRQYVRSYGLADRVKVKSGDFKRDPIGQGYDLILLANILQMYGPADCQRLLRKVYRALKPGGQAVIHGFMTDATGTRPREAAIFALTIGLVTPSGNAHSVPLTARWLKTAGFRDLRMFNIDVIPSSVMVARK
jgi:3-hydroxy-5-methyl-1-naphthoate 3-O-methyltransferase